MNITLAADEMLQKGKRAFLKQCSECHKTDGNSDQARIPKIAGFSSILVYDILDQYKTDDRQSISIKNKNSKDTSMNDIAKALNNEDSEAISYYLSQQQFKAAIQPSDQQLAQQGKALHLDLCENCHVELGTSPIEDAPILRGQWKAYLVDQFEKLSKEKRYIPRRMKNRFRKLNDDDKKALIEFYISPK